MRAAASRAQRRLAQRRSPTAPRRPHKLPLELLAIAAIDGAAGVDVEAADGHGPGGPFVSFGGGGWIDEPQRRLAGALAKRLDAAHGRVVAARKRAVVGLQRIGAAVGVEPLAIEQAAAAQQALGALEGTPGDVREVLGPRLAERVEDELPVPLDVHAIQGLGVGVRVEPERRVEPLDERDRPGVRLLDGAQAELALGAAAQRVEHGLDEGADELTAQLLVVACQVAQLPGQGANPRSHRLRGQEVVGQEGRRVVHASTQTRGQNPRPLQLRPTRRSWPQSPHSTSTAPCARIPQRKYSSNSSTTNPGSGPLCSARSRKVCQCFWTTR